MSASIWYDREDFTVIEDFLWSYLRRGDQYIDVGANIGTTTLTASSAVGSTGRVLAVEPNPRTFRFLKGNIRLNGSTNIAALNMGLGSREGELTFAAVGVGDDEFAVTHGKGVTIPGRRLDSIAGDMGKIALIKIDVEGYEQEVLAGATQTLSNTECVLFEASDAHLARHGSSIRSIIQYLADLEFTTVELTHEGHLIIVEEGYPQRSGVGDNLIATRDVSDLRDRLRLTPSGKLCGPGAEFDIPVSV
jgi:FkbM family methyltransferase